MPTFDVAALISNGLRKVTPSNPRSGVRIRQPWTCKSSRADHLSQAPKALRAMRPLGTQASLVQFRVGAPFC